MFALLAVLSLAAGDGDLIGLDEVRRDLAAHRKETAAEFAKLRDEIDAVRSEVVAQAVEIKSAKKSPVPLCERRTLHLRRRLRLSAVSEEANRDRSEARQGVARRRFAACLSARRTRHFQHARRAVFFAPSDDVERSGLHVAELSRDSVAAAVFAGAGV